MVRVGFGKGGFGTEEEVCFVTVKLRELGVELATCPGFTVPSPYDSWGSL